MLTQNYTFDVGWSKVHRQFVGLCHEFPTLHWMSASIDEARKGIRQLVSDVVRTETQAGAEHYRARARPRPAYLRLVTA